MATSSIMSISSHHIGGGKNSAGPVPKHASGSHHLQNPNRRHPLRAHKSIVWCRKHWIRHLPKCCDCAGKPRSVKSQLFSAMRMVDATSITRCLRSQQHKQRLEYDGPNIPDITLTSPEGNERKIFD